MKILVLGSQGMLGRDLVSRLPGFTLTTVPPITVIGANHAQVDITQGLDTSRFIAQERPDVIVNCAAFTNVDACETYVAEAFAVNTTGAKNIAIAGKEAGAKIIHISTDYVFDGTKNGSYVETDHPNPLSIYGKSKYKGELAIQETIGTYAIIRTSWLYGQYKKKFCNHHAGYGKQEPFGVRCDRSVRHFNLYGRSFVCHLDYHFKESSGHISCGKHRNMFTLRMGKGDF